MEKRFSQCWNQIISANNCVQYLFEKLWERNRHHPTDLCGRTVARNTRCNSFVSREKVLSYYFEIRRSFVVYLGKSHLLLKIRCITNYFIHDQNFPGLTVSPKNSRLSTAHNFQQTTSKTIYKWYYVSMHYRIIRNTAWLAEMRVSLGEMAYHRTFNAWFVLIICISTNVSWHFGGIK